MSTAAVAHSNGYMNGHGGSGGYYSHVVIPKTADVDTADLSIQKLSELLVQILHPEEASIATRKFSTEFEYAASTEDRALTLYIFELQQLYAHMKKSRIVSFFEHLGTSFEFLTCGGKRSNARVIIRCRHRQPIVVPPTVMTAATAMSGDAGTAESRGQKRKKYMRSIIGKVKSLVRSIAGYDSDTEDAKQSKAVADASSAAAAAAAAATASAASSSSGVAIASSIVEESDEREDLNGKPRKRRMTDMMHRQNKHAVANDSGIATAKIVSMVRTAYDKPTVDATAASAASSSSAATAATRAHETVKTQHSTTHIHMDQQISHRTAVCLDRFHAQPEERNLFFNIIKRALSLQDDRTPIDVQCSLSIPHKQRYELTVSGYDRVTFKELYDFEQFAAQELGRVALAEYRAVAAAAAAPLSAAEALKIKQYTPFVAVDLTERKWKLVVFKMGLEDVIRFSDDLRTKLDRFKQTAQKTERFLVKQTTLMRVRTSAADLAEAAIASAAAAATASAAAPASSSSAVAASTAAAADSASTD